jgi:hypothetical protein
MDRRGRPGGGRRVLPAVRGRGGGPAVPSGGSPGRGVLAAGDLGGGAAGAMPPGGARLPPGGLGRHRGVRRDTGRDEPALLSGHRSDPARCCGHAGGARPLGAVGRRRPAGAQLAVGCSRPGRGGPAGARRPRGAQPRRCRVRPGRWGDVGRVHPALRPDRQPVPQGRWPGVGNGRQRRDHPARGRGQRRGRHPRPAHPDPGRSCRRAVVRAAVQPGPAVPAQAPGSDLRGVDEPGAGHRRRSRVPDPGAGPDPH